MWPTRGSNWYSVKIFWRQIQYFDNDHVVFISHITDRQTLQIIENIRYYMNLYFRLIGQFVSIKILLRNKNLKGLYNRSKKIFPEKYKGG